MPRTRLFPVFRHLMGCMLFLWGAGLLLLSLVATVILCIHLRDYRRAQEVYRPVEAVVVTSEVYSSSEQGTWADIAFRYTVDGVDYTSSRYSVLGHSSDLERLKQFPVGSRTTAYYDPDDPAQAVLSREPDAGHWQGLWLFLLGTLVAGFLLLFFGIRSIRRPAGKGTGRGVSPEEPARA